MKDIQISLLDDDLQGDKIYTFDNIQMVNLQRNSDRIKSYQNSTVYILLGPNMLKRQMYIGQTSNIGQRLYQHDKKKDFWSEAIFFLTDKEFTRTETEWFEEHLIKLFIDNNKFDMITNYQIPKNVILNDLEAPWINEIYKSIVCLLNIFGLNISQICASYDNSTSNAIIDRIARAYKYLPDSSDYENPDEEEGIIHLENATYFDIGNGKIIISKGSEVHGNFEKYKDRIENNILIKDILVDSEKEAIKIIRL